MEDKLEKRMYFFTMYNLSGIQNGIQCGHAALEYVELHGQNNDYKDFIKNYKTWIVLSGGSSNNMGKTYYDDTEYYGSMEGLLTEIKEIGVNHAIFNEPDLNNATSAICFLADERVFDYEKYPDFKSWYLETQDISTIESKEFSKTKQLDFPVKYKYAYENWFDNVLGGEMNFQLRQLLKGKRFA